MSLTFSLPPSLLLLLLLLSTHPQRTTAENLTQKYPLRDPNVWKGVALNPEYWANRVFSVSNSSFTANAIRQNATARNLVAPTYHVLQSLYEAFLSRRSGNHPLRCNMRSDEHWLVRKAAVRPQVYQIGKMNLSCPAYMNVNDAVNSGELPARFVDEGGDFVRTGRDAATHALAKIPLPKDPLWRRAYVSTSSRRQRDGYDCQLDTAFGYRINGTWYLRAVITNAPHLRQMPDYQRHYLQEFIAENFTHSLKTIHYRYSERDKLEVSTAFVYTLRGWFATGTGAFTLTTVTGPLRQATRDSDVAVDQAEDSLTSSNIAILSLPMILNFIPAALVTEMPALSMLVYLLFTDIISSIPFLVQGLQLIALARPGKDYMAAYFVGDDRLSQMEIWTGRCKGRRQYHDAGVAFVAIAVGLMVLGVVLEVLAYIYRRRCAVLFGGVGGKDVGSGGKGGIRWRKGPVFLSKSVSERSGERKGDGKVAEKGSSSPPSSAGGGAEATPQQPREKVAEV